MVIPSVHRPKWPWSDSLVDLNLITIDFPVLSRMVLYCPMLWEMGKNEVEYAWYVNLKKPFFQCTYLYIKLHFSGNALSNYVTIYSIYFNTTSPWPHDLYVSAVAEVLVWTDLKLLTPVAYYFFVILKKSKENLQHGKNYYIHCLVHQSFDNFTIIQSRSTLMFISITLHILLRKNMRYPFLIRKEKNVHKYNHGQ